MIADHLLSLKEAQVALQFAARRYTVAHEAHGEGEVVWSDNLISVTDAFNALRELPPAQPRIPDKIIKELTQMSNALDCQTPCTDMFPSDWCEKNCQWPEPQEQCWRRWAEKEMNR